MLDKSLEINEEEEIIGLPDLNNLESIKKWEEQQENSTDIYKISARVKNMVSMSGGSLTDSGTMLCNTYCHVLKSLYDFADKIEDEPIKNSLYILLRSHEDMPSILIKALKNSTSPILKKK